MANRRLVSELDSQPLRGSLVPRLAFGYGSLVPRLTEWMLVTYHTQGGNINFLGQLFWGQLASVIHSTLTLFRVS